MILKRRLCAVLAAAVAFGSVNADVFAEYKLTAFPGAEGGGMYSLGARAAENIEVYHVKNLNDSGYGSFRNAVSKGNRIVVFDVAGNIKLNSILKITDIDNLTVLGQTAPGEGVCISGESVLFSGCDNVILRYLRIRPGDTCYSEEDGLGVRNCTDFIVDHCSVSWSVDECLSAYENKNFTAQYCIISERLNQSLHDKGAHGYGGIWGGINASFHHNLMSTHKSRMPRIGTSATVHSYNDTPDYESLVDIRNNVFYNWRSDAGYGGENGVRVNFVNNYYKPSAAKKSNVFYHSYLGPTRKGTTLYVNGNIMEGNDSVTNDNLSGVMGVPDGSMCMEISDGYIDENGKLWPNDQYLYDYPVTTVSAEEAYSDVLENVGASFFRDDTDRRIVNDVINSTAPTGSRSGYGLIDSPEDVGGYVPLHGIKKQDTDNDGIPDEWEKTNGLDANKADSTEIAANGYTYLENYAEDILNGETDEYPVDFTQLKKLMDEAENADILFFAAKDWEELQNALAYAVNVYNLSQPTQVQTDEAAENLKAALGNIIISDKEYLDAMIERAEKTDLTPYTKESIQRLYDAVAEGKTAGEENYKTAADNIYAAINALKYGSKKNLYDEIKRIESFDLSYLTENSQTQIKNILNEAHKVYNDQTADDESIETAVQSVKEIVTKGHYERRDKGEYTAVQDFENYSNNEIFHTERGSNCFVNTVYGVGSNQSNALTAEHTDLIAWPFVCELPYRSAHFAVSVDIKTNEIPDYFSPLKADYERVGISTSDEAFTHYLEAFDDWGKLSVEVDRVKNTLTWYINDIPIKEELAGNFDYAKTYIERYDVYYDNYTLVLYDREKYMFGDVDADNMLTANDASLVLQKVLIEDFRLPVEDKSVNWFGYADADADGMLSANDAAVIMQKVLLEEYRLPAELATTTQTTTETTTEATTEFVETTTGDTYYPYKTDGGIVYADIINGRIMGADINYTGGRLPDEINGTPIKTVYGGAFENSNIEEIIIPSGYEMIYSGSFRYCKKLKSVRFEECEKMSIGSGAFRGCTALEEVILPENLRKLDTDAFKGCSSLKSLIIPAKTQLPNGPVAELGCILYVSSAQAARYAEDYGYEYVYSVV